MSNEKLTGKNHTRNIICPFCGSADNELFSLFGQTLIGTQYYCHSCHTVFEVVRWEERDDEEKDDDGL
jgi:hypothetical protein